MASSSPPVVEGGIFKGPFARFDHVPTRDEVYRIVREEGIETRRHMDMLLVRERQP